MNIEIEGVSIAVTPSDDHEWTLTTDQAADGFGVSSSVIRSHKGSHADELHEGKHFLSVQNMDAGNQALRKTAWTKRGVVRLGFFIRSKRARRFRDLAEDLVLDRFPMPKSADALSLARALVASEDQRLALTAKANFVDRLSVCAGTVSIATLAQSLGTGRNQLFKWLRAKRYLIRESGQNRPLGVYVNRGLFKVTYGVVEVHGIQRRHIKILVTSKGMAQLGEHWTREHHHEQRQT